MPGQYSSAIQLLSQPRRAILQHLKEHEPLRAEDMARDLHVTVSGIRQHLAALSAEGLVTHDVVRGQPGRPKHVFRLTERGHELFPRDYVGLAAELIQFVDDEDATMMDRMYERRIAGQLNRLRLVSSDGSLRQRVHDLATVLDSDGFMAAVEERDGGVLLLVERNCALLQLARVDERICNCEFEFLQRALPDADIRRTEHTLDRGPHCVYEIRPRREGDAA